MKINSRKIISYSNILMNKSPLDEGIIDTLKQNPNRVKRTKFQLIMLLN